MKRYSFIFLLCSLLALGGCSTSTPIRIPNPESFELKGDRYYLTCQNERTYRVDSLKVKNDSVYIKGKTIYIKDVKSIETRSFSPMKSIGLAAGIISLTTTAGVAYLYYLVAYERASEK